MKSEFTERVTKKRGGRRKRGQFFIHEYTCIGCGESKSWTFIDPSDFESHLLAQNSCCAKCYVEKVVPDDQLNKNLPLIRWPEELTVGDGEPEEE